jgi:uncharacterized membrane protein YfcA
MAMSLEESILATLILLTAMLYSSVGHGGASGYLAAMALMGLAPDVMRPVALMLNILVASIAVVKFCRVGAFSWKLFWPFACTSVPFAYLGGTMTLSGHIYKPLVGMVLLFSAWHIYRTTKRVESVVTQRPPLSTLLSAGAALGFLSGLTGVGGGIFISPLLLYFRWAEVRVISGISAAFILANSISGLLGVGLVQHELPTAFIYWALAAVVGAWIGAEYGSKRLSNATIRRFLGLVLLIAGCKMLVTGLMLN